MLLWPYNTTEQQRVETAWLAEAVSRKKKLKGHRAFAMSPWMAALDPAASSLFQIGANKHESTSYINTEPGPLAVHHGWKSTLLEPIPDIFKQLQRTYTPQPPNVELVNAAVCDQCAAAPLKMWSVDMSNATGNWGSNDSDARCLTANTPGGNGSHFVSEIASLSKCSAPCANRDQTQAHSSRPPSADAPSGRTCSATIATLPWGQTSVLSAQRYSAGRCQTTACARRLDEGEGDMRGSPSSLTLSCHATQVIANNLVTFPVRCYCAETELVPQLRHAQRGGAAALSLLVRASREINERGHGCVRASHAQNNRVACEAVDAEGHDDAALYQFPFALVRPARVVFESTHLTSLRFLRCAASPPPFDAAHSTYTSPYLASASAGSPSSCAHMATRCCRSTPAPSRVRSMVTEPGSGKGTAFGALPDTIPIRLQSTPSHLAAAQASRRLCRAAARLPKGSRPLPGERRRTCAAADSARPAAAQHRPNGASEAYF